MNRLRASAAEDERARAPPVVLPEIAAEAAVWVARLHGPDRSSRMERECRAWQARSAAHREAFERCTETWVDVPRVTLADAYASASAAPGKAGSGSARSAGRPTGARWGYALALVAMVVGGGVVFQQWHRPGAYSTGVGEQQLVVLDDGTRMSLNTATRVRVDLGSAQRTVSIQEGEAIFEVAKDARRPFVVRVADSEVVALGTVFSVRLTPSNTLASNSLAVTLIEGQVTVRSAQAGLAGGVAPAQPVLMHPGERVRLVKESSASAVGAVVKVDRPRIEQVVAWKRSEAVFDNVSLAEAVAEMNRYSRTQIVLFGDATLDGRRVSGVFRTGDNTAFARAVAALHGLRVLEQPDRLELAPG